MKLPNNAVPHHGQIGMISRASLFEIATWLECEHFVNALHVDGPRDRKARLLSSLAVKTLDISTFAWLLCMDESANQS